MSFEGTVVEVAYDVKGAPSVTVEGSEYYISAIVNFRHKIEVGDVFIKKKGEMKFKFVKRKTGEFLYFKSLLSDKKRSQINGFLEISYFSFAKLKRRWAKISIFRLNQFSDS